MTKRGFNILVETEYLDILEAFRRFYGLDSSTEAFRCAINRLKAEEGVAEQLKLIQAEKERLRCRKEFVPAVKSTTSDKNTSKNASTAKKKNANRKEKP